MWQTWAYTMLSPLVFAPDTAGTPPGISVEVLDLKKGNQPRCSFLPRKVVVRTWNDFLPYVGSQLPEVAAMPSDPNRSPEGFTQSVVPGDSVGPAVPVCGAVQGGGSSGDGGKL